MEKSAMLWFLVQCAIKYLNAERLKKWTQYGCNQLREAIEEDGVTDWKDKAVLPMLDTIEKAFDLDED